MTYLHVCITCGNLRSIGYHREHPLLPGQLPQASECRRCTRRHYRGDETSTSNNSGDDTKASKSEPKSPRSKKPCDIKDFNPKSKPKGDKEPPAKSNTVPNIDKGGKFATDKKPTEDSGPLDNKEGNFYADKGGQGKSKEHFKGVKDQKLRAQHSIDSLLAELSLSDDEKVTVIRFPRKRKPKESVLNRDPEKGNYRRTKDRHSRKSDDRINSYQERSKLDSSPVKRYKGHVETATEYPDYTSSESSFTRHIRQAGWREGIQHVPARVMQGNRIPRRNEGE
jgi:hypothetical protein